MVDTREAARILGVSTGRIRQLVAAGQLEAEKLGRGWRISEESLASYRLRAKPGRPKKTDARWQSDAYTLMSRNHEVAAIGYSCEQGRFTRVQLLDKRRAPLPLVSYRARGGEALLQLNRWWGGRTIPDTRAEVETRLAELELVSTQEIPLRSLGLSLSDQYWLRPEGSSLTWERVNYFQNDYELGPVSGADSLSIWLNAVGLDSPDNTSDGQLPKRWLIDPEGRRVLIKAGEHAGLEAINEVVATRLYHRLLHAGEYVEYCLAEWRGQTVCVCETFVGPEEEYIPALYISGMYKRNNSANAYQHYFEVCCSLGAVDAVRLLDKMLVCDFILANADRHWRNFGLVRNVETLALRAAPVFDTGSCLWADQTVRTMERQHYRFTVKPFFEDPNRQLGLVVNPRWFDPDILDGFVEEVHRIYLEQTAEASRADAVCCGLEGRIKAVKAWYAKTPRLAYAPTTGVTETYQFIAV